MPPPSLGGVQVATHRHGIQLREDAEYHLAGRLDGPLGPRNHQSKRGGGGGGNVPSRSARRCFLATSQAVVLTNQWVQFCVPTPMQEGVARALVAAEQPFQGFPS